MAKYCCRSPDFQKIAYFGVWDREVISISGMIAGHRVVHPGKLPLERVFCLLDSVDELINPWRGRWEEDLILDNFVSVDVERILRIPLSTQLTEDFVAWHFDSKGIFSVKSAYKIHVQMMKDEARRLKGQSSSDVQPTSEGLRAIWKVKCPPRVHHFLWRLAHNCHPMYMNISR